LFARPPAKQCRAAVGPRRHFPRQVWRVGAFHRPQDQVHHVLLGPVSGDGRGEFGPPLVASLFVPNSLSLGDLPRSWGSWGSSGGFLCRWPSNQSAADLSSTAPISPPRDGGNVIGTNWAGSLAPRAAASIRSMKISASMAVTPQLLHSYSTGFCTLRHYHR